MYFRNGEVININIEDYDKKFEEIENKIEKINMIDLFKEYYIADYFKNYDVFQIKAGQNLKIYQFGITDKIENILIDVRINMKISSYSELYQHKYLYIIIEILNNNNKKTISSGKTEIYNDYVNFNNIFYINNKNKNNIICNIMLFHNYNLYNNVNFIIDKNDSKVQTLKYYTNI